MSQVREMAREMKLAAPEMASTSGEMRNQALARVKEALLASREEIFTANKEDLRKAEEKGVSDAIRHRLKFGEEKLQDVTRGIDELIGLPDPCGWVQLARELDEGLRLYRIACPIGVIGVIFEARPDAMVQVSSLCLKSGNCAILKGGSETAETNRVLFRIIHEAAAGAGLPELCLCQVEAHAEIDELLSCSQDVDLLIPRGSNAFVRYIMDHTKIPVMGHSDGICHIYVDRAADFAKAVPVIVDAKVQYTAACNAVETLLVHREIAESLLPPLAEALRKEGVRILGDPAVRQIIDCGEATDSDWSTEYLDLVISVKIVDEIQEAIDHINRFGSHHTDAIITEDPDAAARFMALVDSAGVYQNCSTRFADGFRYGFGAEVGISTGKLHARGPVGLEGLMTYKYEIFGNGQVVGDYASGKRSFHFRDLPLVRPGASVSGVQSAGAAGNETSSEGGALTDLPVSDFTADLGSKKPVPGGGGAAALAGALAAALGEMTGAYTMGKKAYEAQQEKVSTLMERAENLRGRLLSLVEEDARAFRSLSEAYRIPKEDPGRAEAMEQAAKGAAEAPLRILECAAETVEVLEGMAECGSRALQSDTACGAYLAGAAMECARANILVNTKSFTDREAAEKMENRTEAILKEYLPRARKAAEAAEHTAGIRG